MRHIDMPSPSTIAKFCKVIPAEPLSTTNLSQNYAAVSMRKKREADRARAGTPGQVVQFRYGLLNRKKTGTLTKVSSDGVTATIESGKHRTRFIVKTSSIVRP
jgi:hypothetical protein